MRADHAWPGPTEIEPVLVALSEPEANGDQRPLAAEGVPPGDQHALLLAAGTRLQVDGVEKEGDQVDAREVACAEGQIAAPQLSAERVRRTLRDMPQARPP